MEIYLINWSMMIIRSERTNFANGKYFDDIKAFANLGISDVGPELEIR